MQENCQLEKDAAVQCYKGNVQNPLACRQMVLSMPFAFQHVGLILLVYNVASSVVTACQSDQQTSELICFCVRVLEGQGWERLSECLMCGF
jgi:hypothetical protein